MSKEPIPRRDPDHCAAGHDLAICGVYVHPKTGYQECRACRSIHYKRSRVRSSIGKRRFTARGLERSAGDG
jgi:hypothetical protein